MTNENEVKTLYDKNNDTFQMRCSNGENISVLEAGYIITPNGDFVDVKDDENHSEIFSCYLRNYDKLNNNAYFESTDAAVILTDTDHHHIVYFGLKMADASAIYNNKSTDGFAIICLPEDLIITDEQKEAIKKLLSTNKSIFGNREILEVKIGTLRNGELDKEEADKLFTSNSNKK